MVIILESMVSNMAAEEKMIETKYGYFSASQIAYHIKEIQKMIFWGLLYVDPKTAVRYPGINVPDYLKGILKKIVGFNSLMQYPNELVCVVSTLEAALNLLEGNDFSFQEYRKLILDAGAMAGKLKVGE